MGGTLNQEMEEEPWMVIVMCLRVEHFTPWCPSPLTGLSLEAHRQRKPSRCQTILGESLCELCLRTAKTEVFLN